MTKVPRLEEDDALRMDAQYAEAKEELLAELKEKTTTITIKDFTLGGIRAEYNLQGEIRGRYNASHIETVSALFKPDGTLEYEGRGIDTTGDGDTVLVTIKGEGRQENPITARFKGENTFQTPSKKLAWLNTTKGRHEGTYNSATGEVSVKLYGKM